MANRRYIGKEIPSSDLKTDGVLSVTEHRYLTGSNKISQEFNLPESNGIQHYLPTTGFRNTYTIASGSFTGSGRPKYISHDGKYFFTIITSTVYQFRLTIPYELDSIDSTLVNSRNMLFDSDSWGIYFGLDGLRLYICGITTDKVYQYNLSSPYDLDTVAFTGKTFDTATSVLKEVTPREIFFSRDGDKMYIIGQSSDAVFQVNLSTPWELDSAYVVGFQQFDARVTSAAVYGTAFGNAGSYVYLTDSTSDMIYGYHLSTPYDLNTVNGKNSYLGDTEISPVGGYFKYDGNVFYCSGSNKDNIYEIHLNTPWEISTANSIDYQVKKFHYATGTHYNTNSGFFFKPDGTRFYVIDTSSDSVHQYVLSSAWDPGTITYGGAFSIGSQEASARDIHFKSDGTKMYVTGDTGDDVNEYNLSTPWDVTTASFFQLFSVSGQELTLRSIEFSNDGTKMYIMGTTGDDVNQYNLSNAWDISTAVYSTNFSVSAQGATVPESLTFNGDGTAMYVIDGAVATGYVTKYTLGTPWDISTASYDPSEYWAIPYYSAMTKMRFDGNGSNVLVMTESTTAVDDIIYMIPLTTPYNINTVQSNQAGMFNNEATPTGIYWGNSGTFLYVVGSTGDAVDQYEAVVPWKVSTLRYIRQFSVAGQETVPQSVYFSPDGIKMFVLGSTGDDINEYTLGTAWNISTASFTQTQSVSAQDTVPSGFAFTADGTKMFLVGQTGDNIDEYTLSNPWDISTLTPTGNILNIAFLETTPTGLALGDNGNKIYLTGQVVDCVQQIDLKSANTITTYEQDMLYIGDKEATITALTFKPDGTKLYIVGTTSDTVHEYNLSTPWRVHTATFNQSFSVSGQEATPYAIEFKPDGTKMYIHGTTGDDVNEYTLSTPWDISTASFVTTFSVASQETNGSGMAFSPDGNTFCIIGITGDSFFQYSMSSPWDISTASYQDSFLINCDTLTPYSLAFNSDGTKIFTYDNTNKRMLGYTLSIPYNISKSSVTYPRIRTNTDDPVSLGLSPDGRTVYVSTGVASPFKLEFYSLPTPFELSNVSYTELAISTSTSLRWNSEPSGRYLIGRNNDTGDFYVYQTPNKNYTANNESYSVATVDLSAGSKNFNAQETAIRAFTFANAGTKLYLTGTTGDDVNEYTLNPAWDITTATFNNTLNTTPYVWKPVGLRVFNEGKNLVVFCGERCQIIKYELTTPYDTSTAVFMGISDHITYESGTRRRYDSAYFSPDCTSVYLNASNDADTIHHYYLREGYIPYTNSSLVYFDTDKLDVQQRQASNAMTTRQSLSYSADGTKLYTVHAYNNKIEQWGLTAPFILDENMRLEYNLSIADKETSSDDIFMHPEGTKLYIIGNSSNSIHEYTLSVPWEISSATFTNTVSYSSQATDATGFTFNSEGTRAYIVSLTNFTVYEYVLGTPWDTSTLTYNNSSLSLTPNLFKVLTTNLDGGGSIQFNEDGTQLNVMTTHAATITSYAFRYTLSTPWDISSATYLDYVTFNSLLQTAHFSDIFKFSDEGRIVSLMRSNYYHITSFKLRVPYDLRTIINASLGERNNIALNDATLNYVALSENGTLVFASAATYINTWMLTTPWDLNSAVKTLTYIPASSQYQFLDESGQHFFYSTTSTIFKLDLSGVN